MPVCPWQWRPGMAGPPGAGEPQGGRRKVSRSQSHQQRTPCVSAVGRHVSGTCRDEEACDNFRSEGVDAHVLDADNELHLRCSLSIFFRNCLSISWRDASAIGSTSYCTADSCSTLGLELRISERDCRSVAHGSQDRFRGATNTTKGVVYMLLHLWNAVMEPHSHGQYACSCRAQSNK